MSPTGGELFRLSLTGTGPGDCPSACIAAQRITRTPRPEHHLDSARMRDEFVHTLGFATITRMRTSANHSFLLLSFIVAVLAGVVFIPGLPGDFVFDDIPNIVNNKAIQLHQLDARSVLEVIATPQLSGNMRTLPTLSFAIDFWRAGGADPATFKTTNIVIHAITTCALAWFFRSLMMVSGIPRARAQWPSAVLALVWAIHPLQVSSVLYPVQRMQTMATLFVILALLAYIQARMAQRHGRPSRKAFLATFFLSVLAMACKEDAVMLPAYALALELTVLNFSAANARTAQLLRWGYMVASVAGAALFVLVAAPYFWQWEAYPGRDFSTLERLLTQARVLCMYAWQILVPLPQNMPFYYDWFQPSRGLLEPWTTLPAIALLGALLTLAFRMRARHPLFALGVFVFFGAHFISSNVVGLELAFEHRNHFALAGAILAIGSLLLEGILRMRPRTAKLAILCAIPLLSLSYATILRAHDWRSRMALARTSTELAPNSARAWILLCAGHYEAGGGAVKANPFLDEAIDACSNGAALAPYALNNPALLVVLKTLQGNVAPQDWARLQQRIETVHMSPDNRRAPLILTHNAREGVELEKRGMLRALSTLLDRAPLKPFEIASISYFIMNDLGEPDLALPYFVKAIQSVPPGDPFAGQLADELRAKGRPDLAASIENLERARLRLPAAER